jgi:hypothetical protein
MVSYVVFGAVTWFVYLRRTSDVSAEAPMLANARI